MIRSLIILLGAMLSAMLFSQMACSPTQHTNGPLRVSSDNSRYFMDASGRVVYLAGSHTWLNIQDGAFNGINEKFDYAEYIQFLNSYHYNYTRLWAWESAVWVMPNSSFVRISPLPYQRTGPGKALDGKPKFDLKQFNQAYFGRLRRRVEMARENCIYVSVMLFQGFSVARKIKNRKQTPWLGHPFNRDNNVNGVNGDVDGDGKGYETHTLQLPQITRFQERYVQKVIETLNDFDNVIYEISNESQGASTKWQYHFINFIHAVEKKMPLQHPVMMTYQWDGIAGKGNNQNLFTSPAEAISPGNDDRQKFPNRNNPPPTDGSKVILFDTDHLWGIGGSDVWVWKSFTRGYNPVFMDAYKNSPYQPTPKMQQKWEPLRKAMGQTYDFALKLDLTKMHPDTFVSSTKYCLANPGKEYLVFQPDSASFSIDLKAGNYLAEWFNPLTGRVAKTENIRADGKRIELTPPFVGKSILYLKSH